MKRSRAAIGTILLMSLSCIFGQTMRILSFRVNRHSIRSGDVITLSWETTGTSSVTMEWRPLVGDKKMTGGRTGLPPKGTLDERPRVSTIYILECASESGVLCASSSLTVFVK